MWRVTHGVSTAFDVPTAYVKKGYKGYNQFKQLGLDQQRALNLARNLHAHSVKYAHKLVTTRRAIENKNTSHSQVLEPGASSNPPAPH
eukprot:1147141-Pelagomonas_calceolata.AAC.2